ncbi:diguanylate cyclase [uncultured Williamsia sp.]|uniref:GGDEF domain-containing protein n=1 Tax=uncultured Williamsia sp. TaxID=259311 RepID=UPI002604258E|nr:GGDEF domain-containing protein [uncultured Williamsia sp.]
MAETTPGSLTAEQHHILSAIPVDRRPLRRAVCVVILLFGVVGVSAVFSPGLITTLTGQITTLVVCATTIPMALWFRSTDMDTLWWSPEDPSVRWRGFGFLVWADIGTSSVHASLANPLLGLVGAPLFAPVCAFGAFFGTRATLAFHTVWINGYLIVMAVRLVESDLVPSTPAAIGAAGCGVIGLNATTLLLAVFSKHIKNGLRSQRRETDTDPLTGLWNRRGFDYHAARLVETTSADAPISVLLVDIDRYKKFNDTHGHHRGDLALREVAAVLGRFGDSSVVGRLGGDEFGIVSVADRPTFADEVCRAVRAADIAGLTVSVGGTTLRRGGVDDLQVALVIADNALYVAKRDGGGRSHQIAGASALGDL